VEVEQPPEEGLGQHPRARVPLEGNGHELRLVAARAQLVHELPGHDLGPAPREWNLRANDRDPHFGSLRSDSTSAWSRSTWARRSSIRRRAAALKDRWSYAGGSTHQGMGVLGRG